MGFRDKLVKLSKINQHRADQLEAVRRTWVQEVNALYKAITEDWFDEYMKDGYVTVEHRELQYAESEADVLKFHFSTPGSGFVLLR